MAGKFQRITDLYQRAMREVTKSPENWVSFLRSASRNYCLPFDEQILVHVQRPDAAAVLQIEHWNRRFGRWVRKGSKGIAVLDQSAGQMALKYYFDISDTQEGRNQSLVRSVPLWEVREESWEEVRETLANAFSAGDGESLENTILRVSRNIAEENMLDYLEDVLAERENSTLEELDEMNVRLKVRTILENSVALMLLTRCGCDVQAYLALKDFSDIVDFDTPELINILGTAASDLGELPLREIADTIGKQLRYEKKRYRTFAFGGGGGYSVAIGERKEGNEDDRNRIQRTRGLPSSQSDRAGGKESRWEVRITPQEVSEGEPLRKISESADAGETEPAPVADSARRHGEDGDARLADETGTGRDRRAQGGESDGVGRQDELHPAGSGGNRFERTDLQLKDSESSSEDGTQEEKTDTIMAEESAGDAGSGEGFAVELPTAEEQMELMAEAGDETSSAFSSFEGISQEDIDSALIRGNQVANGKYRICRQFGKGEEKKSNVEFLKKEYGTGGGTHTYPDGTGGHVSYSGKGIAIEKKGSYTAQYLLLSWSKVEKRLRELIQNNRYLNPYEKDHYADFLGRIAAPQYEIDTERKLARQRFILEKAELPPAEKRDTLALRLADFIRDLDGYEKSLLENVGRDDLADVTADQMEQHLSDPATAQNLLDFLALVQGKTTDTYARSNAWRFSQELKGLHPVHYVYQEGDAVYIDAEQYEILTVSENTVSLRNVEFPLFGKDYNRDDFENKLKENPANDHLQTIMIESRETEIPAGKKPDSIAFSIEFSEHPAFYDRELNDRFTELSFALGNRLLGVLDEKQHYERQDRSKGIGWYKKTDFTIHAVIGGEEFNYEGRFDIGDGEGDLIAHIRNFYEYYLSQDCPFIPVWKQQGEDYYRKRMENLHLGQNVFLPFLEQHTRLTPEDERLLAEIMATETDWYRNTEEKAQPGETTAIGKQLTIQVEQGALEQIPAGEKEGQGEESPQEALDEIEELNDILSAMKIEDISLDYEDGVLRARDEDGNEWMGEGFYHFLLEEAIALEEDGTSKALTGGQLEDLCALAERYGIMPDAPGLPAEEEKKAGMPVEKGNASGLPAGGGDVVESQADLTPAWERKPPKAGLRELHPEIPPSERNQYRIVNDMLGQGTPKEKFRANIAAIQLLRKCESENRLATPDEQEILAGYVGWGGLSDAFDETKTAWSKEYLELKRVLTEEEYAAARESTLTAFYTPPVVIRAMYQALENMGLKSANILEPSCGVGNFIGMKPESLSDCKIYGVEIDGISARIAGQLYQQSRIAASGYEDVAMPDSFFDVAVGNVPFGQFKVSDRKYDKHGFLIHDYFFAKTLDKVRPGGIIAFITSYGTMDKKNGAVRKYIAERADLLGAIRLPNDTFEKNAGTKVTSDILFLQKRESLSVEEPDWLFLDTNENGVPMNRYFTTHPEMILGEMVMESSRFGMDSTCKPREGVSLESQLMEAIRHIHAEIRDYETEELVEEDDQTIPANPEVENFSYTLVEGRIYYRENSRMKPVELSITGQNRVRGMIAIRDSVRKLLAYQTEDYSDSDIKKEQENLNGLYDAFQKKYGLLNSRGNSMVFSEDNSYPLLCSLEVLREDGTLERKADMFYKRTVNPNVPVNRVDTPEEALAVTLAERAEVDLGRMEELCGKSRAEIEKELGGVIFRLPDAGEPPVFVTADEYLSGNVREKLKAAVASCKSSEVYRRNVEALEKVQPEDLSATEIKVRLGTTWIPADDFQDFMYDLLQTSEYNKRFIKVHYSEITSQWSVEGKKRDRGNARAESTYGTNRANAYRIIEDSLNLRDTRVYDYIEDEEGRRKAVLNKKETAAAQGKQEAIRQAFEDWIWKDPERRGRLVRQYNDTFNAIRPREYDGSHFTFPSMNPEIRLRTHQNNAIARIIYGGNTLLAHVVGAGKTYTMVAAAMKMKQMGLCHKSMVVVPNHIIEQFAAEWLQLYPSANILVATKKSFEKKNRRKFCARIATGEYDAVIIGHSQFERIPMSLERQKMVLEQQKREVLAGIDEMKKMEGGRFTVKQLEKTKKSLNLKLKKLNNTDRKDDVITFEQLGIDRLFVDEADNYKNLFLFTKMRNVGGISQTDAQKSSDMFMKCRYMDELTGGKGIIFATGTPVSNSMVELYTMQRYLQYGLLEKYQLIHFDCWASMFGETVTALELAPEGTGYRLKTRFARFHNIPEMMKMFKEVADIQTEDMLNLPVPKANYRVVKVKPSDIQKEMVEKLAERAERIRNGMVDPRVDNMLKITNEGRKLALDQRIINDLLPDEQESKVNACVGEVVTFWKRGADKKLTQLIFSDLSTPKNGDSFSVYDDLRKKLTEAGIPKEEIVFIHEADTDVKKKALFAKVRNGSVRVLIGSTFKMGAGTNVQDLIIAAHDLDVPWRPRDLEQRRGRVVRQGNKNPEVDVIRYVTEGTFDAYMYQTIEKKQHFISQIMTSKNPARSMEDVDMAALSYAEIKALASGNPQIKEKMDLEVEVSKLQILKQTFLSQKYELENKIKSGYPRRIKEMERRIECYEQDIATEKENTPTLKDSFPVMQIWDKTYTEKKEAGKALVEACQCMKSPDEIQIGSYRGFSLGLSFDSFSKQYNLIFGGSQRYTVALGTDILGNITRIDNAIAGLPDKLEQCRMKLESVRGQFENAKEEASTTFSRFSKEGELREKSARLEEINALLEGEETAFEDVEQDGEEPESVKKNQREMVR